MLVRQVLNSYMIQRSHIGIISPLLPSWPLLALPETHFFVNQIHYPTYVGIFMLSNTFEVEGFVVDKELCALHFHCSDSHWQAINIRGVDCWHSHLRREGKGRYFIFRSLTLTTTEVNQSELMGWGGGGGGGGEGEGGGRVEVGRGTHPDLGGVTPKSSLTDNFLHLISD